MGRKYEYRTGGDHDTALRDRISAGILDHEEERCKEDRATQDGPGTVYPGFYDIIRSDDRR